MGGFLNYEAINTAVHTVINNSNINVAGVMIGCRVLALAFILINWLKEMPKRKGNPEESKKNLLPIGLDSLAGGVMYMLVVVSWPQITQTVDNILGSYVESFDISEQSKSLSMLAEFDRRYDQERLKESLDLPADNSVTGMLGSLLTLFEDVLYGTFYGIILYIVKAIAWLVSVIAYPIFLLERAFLLFLMNIIGPLVIAMAALDKYRDMIYRWFKVYCAVFITGLFFVYVNWFCESIFEALYNIFRDNVLANNADGFDYQDRHMVEVCIFTAIALTKVKLFGSAISLSNRIFA